MVGISTFIPSTFGHGTFHELQCLSGISWEWNYIRRSINNNPTISMATEQSAFHDKSKMYGWKKQCTVFFETKHRDMFGNPLIYLSLAECCAASLTELCLLFFYVRIITKNSVSTFIYLWWPAANKLSPATNCIAYFWCYLVTLALRTWWPCPTSPPHPVSAPSVPSFYNLLFLVLHLCTFFNAFFFFNVSSQTKCAGWEMRPLPLDNVRHNMSY